MAKRKTVIKEQQIIVQTSVTSVPSGKCEGCDKTTSAPENPLTEGIKEFIERVTKSPVMKNDDVNKLFKTYNYLFNRATQRCNCPGQIRSMLESIQKYIDKNDGNS